MISPHIVILRPFIGSYDYSNVTYGSMNYWQNTQMYFDMANNLKHDLSHNGMQNMHRVLDRVR